MIYGKNTTGKQEKLLDHVAKWIWKDSGNLERGRSVEQPDC